MFYCFLEISYRKRDLSKSKEGMKTLYIFRDPMILVLSKYGFTNDKVVLHVSKAGDDSV